MAVLDVWINCETVPELWMSNRGQMKKWAVQSMRGAQNRNKEHYDNRNLKTKWNPCCPGQLIKNKSHRRPDAPESSESDGKGRI